MLLRGHNFNIVPYSYYPLYVAVVVFNFVLLLCELFHNNICSVFALIVKIYFVYVLVKVILSWLDDITMESLQKGTHTNKVRSGLRLGMVLFIVTEVMFFFSFFWSCFHVVLSPSLIVENIYLILLMFICFFFFLFFIIMLQEIKYMCTQLYKKCVHICLISCNIIIFFLFINPYIFFLFLCFFFNLFMLTVNCSGVLLYNTTTFNDFFITLKGFINKTISYYNFFFALSEEENPSLSDNVTEEKISEKILNFPLNSHSHDDGANNSLLLNTDNKKNLTDTYYITKEKKIDKQKPQSSLVNMFFFDNFVKGKETHVFFKEQSVSFLKKFNKFYVVDDIKLNEKEQFLITIQVEQEPAPLAMARKNFYENVDSCVALKQQGENIVVAHKTLDLSEAFYTYRCFLLSIEEAMMAHDVKGNLGVESIVYLIKDGCLKIGSDSTLVSPYESIDSSAFYQINNNCLYYLRQFYEELVKRYNISSTVSYEVLTGASGEKELIEIQTYKIDVREAKDCILYNIIKEQYGSKFYDAIHFYSYKAGNKSYFKECRDQFQEPYQLGLINFLEKVTEAVTLPQSVRLLWADQLFEVYLDITLRLFDEATLIKRTSKTTGEVVTLLETGFRASLTNESPTLLKGERQDMQFLHKLMNEPLTAVQKGVRVNRTLYAYLTATRNYYNKHEFFNLNFDIYQKLRPLYFVKVQDMLFNEFLDSRVNFKGSNKSLFNTLTEDEVSLLDDIIAIYKTWIEKVIGKIKNSKSL